MFPNPLYFFKKSVFLFLHLTIKPLIVRTFKTPLHNRKILCLTKRTQNISQKSTRKNPLLNRQSIFQTICSLFVHAFHRNERREWKPNPSLHAEAYQLSVSNTKNLNRLQTHRPKLTNSSYRHKLAKPTITKPESKPYLTNACADCDAVKFTKSYIANIKNFSQQTQQKDRRSSKRRFPTNTPKQNARQPPRPHTNPNSHSQNHILTPHSDTTSTKDTQKPFLEKVSNFQKHPPPRRDEKANHNKRRELYTPTPSSLLGLSPSPLGERKTPDP